MSNAQEKLRAARESLGEVLGKRRATKEYELDECVPALEELRRACMVFRSLPPTEAAEGLDVIRAGFDEVIARIKNRPKHGEKE